jgi:hypothetical protein
MIIIVESHQGGLDGDMPVAAMTRCPGVRSAAFDSEEWFDVRTRLLPTFVKISTEYFAIKSFHAKTP